MPMYLNALAEEHTFKVLDLWNHCPTTWAAHIDMTLCPTAAELIKIASQKHAQGIWCSGDSEASRSHFWSF
jgi:hypothetical protein